MIDFVKLCGKKADQKEMHCAHVEATASAYTIGICNVVNPVDVLLNSKVKAKITKIKISLNIITC